MLNALITSSKVLPVRTACEEAWVASCVLSWASATKSSTCSMRATATAWLLVSNSPCSAARSNSRENRSKPLPSPVPNSNNRPKTGANSACRGNSSRSARFRSMWPAEDSNRSRKGSIREASETVEALASNCVAMFAWAWSSAR